MIDYERELLELLGRARKAGCIPTHWEVSAETRVALLKSLMYGYLLHMNEDGVNVCNLPLKVIRIGPRRSPAFNEPRSDTLEDQFHLTLAATHEVSGRVKYFDHENNDKDWCQ